MAHTSQLNEHIGPQLPFGGFFGLLNGLFQPVVLVATNEEQQHREKRDEGAKDRIESAVVRVDKSQDGLKAFWIFGWFGLPVAALLVDRASRGRDGLRAAWARRISAGAFVLWCSVTGFGPLAWGVWSAMR